MNKVRFLSKITLVASLIFALAFTLNACDNGSNDDGEVSSVGSSSSSSEGVNQGGANWCVYRVVEFELCYEIGKYFQGIKFTENDCDEIRNMGIEASLEANKPRDCRVLTTDDPGTDPDDETPLVKKTIVLSTAGNSCADAFTGEGYSCGSLTKTQAEKVNVIGAYSENTAGSVYAPGSNEFKNILIGKGVSADDIYDVMFIPIPQKYVSTLKNAVNESDLEPILDDLFMDLMEGEPVLKIYSDPNTAFWVYNDWTEELVPVIINTASNDRIELISILE